MQPIEYYYFLIKKIHTMKFRTYLIQVLFLAGLAFVFLNNSGGRANQANDGNTGAPGESGTVCGNCHSSAAYGMTTTTLSINETGTANPVTAYTPGTTYDVILTVNNTVGTPSGYGFQMTALEGSNVDVADFNPTSINTQLATANNVGGRRYVEQDGTSSSNTFTMQWTAPSVGTGDVTFYRIGNSVNNSNSLGGDTGGSGETTVLPEAVVAPVELSFFEATYKHQAAYLTWQTQTETNNAYFEIEHSSDGRTFETLHKIEGAGNSTHPQSYSYRHDKMAEGANYYRLTQVDFNGSFEYSEVVSLIHKTTSISLYPNPVQDRLNVQLEQDMSIKVMRIYNNQGQLLETISTASTSIDVADLESGLYWLSIVFDNGEELSRRFLK